MTNIFIAALGLCWLFSKKTFSKSLTTKILFSFITFYSLHIVSLAYSSDLLRGINILEKKIPLCLIPLFILSKDKINSKLFPYIIGIFSFASLTNTLYSSIKVLTLTTVQWQKFIGYTGKDYRLAFSQFSDIHPTYFSIFLLISTSFIIYFTYKNRASILALSIGLLLILAMIIVSLSLASRTPLLAFLTLLSLGILYIFHKKKRLSVALIIIIIGSSILGIIGYKIESIRYRFEELKKTELTPPIGSNHNSTNIRVGLLRCSTEISKVSGFFGAGIGDSQKELNDCYKSNNYSEILYLEEYNAHNQYLEIVISIGILGLALFLVLNYLLLLHAYRYKNYLHVLFTTFLLLCCLTESILEVNKGIILFSLFHSIFVRISQHKPVHLKDKY